jgi:hypothetical protein
VLEIDCSAQNLNMPSNLQPTIDNQVNAGSIASTSNSVQNWLLGLPETLPEVKAFKTEYLEKFKAVDRHLANAQQAAAWLRSNLKDLIQAQRLPEVVANDFETMFEYLLGYMDHGLTPRNFPHHLMQAVVQTREYVSGLEGIKKSISEISELELSDDSIGEIYSYINRFLIDEFQVN